MILVTRFNGSKFYINAEMVRSVESTPDTVITLSSGEKILVKDKAEDVVRKIIVYKRMINISDIDIQVGE
jgi:flagellar protein FlbD